MTSEEHPTHTPRAAIAPLAPRLAALVSALRSRGDALDRSALLSTLGGCDVELDDVSAYVEESADGYTRRRVVRTDAFELLVMTWRAGQGSTAHDHTGSLCALRVLRGRAREGLFREAPDGLVDERSWAWVDEGEVLVDGGERVHAISNPDDAAQTLVTLHVYAPPLAELRRFPRRTDPAIESALGRARTTGAPVIAIVGGGFSGTLTAANLVRVASEQGDRVHVVLLDRQAAIGEGAAYRTADPRHLLNVPASGMSAWPDRPEHFLEWQRAHHHGTDAYDFVPRRAYGDYVRACLAEVAGAAPPSVSVEIRRTDVQAAALRQGGGFELDLAKGRVTADAVILATGHRPPDDPLASLWKGSRTRYVEDPWASLALGAIEPHEEVVLLGTGLTAVDVLLTLLRRPRTAPVLAISRRGLRPQVHADAPIAREDPSAWLEPLLACDGGPRTRELLAELRGAIRRASARGQDWRAVIDGLRPHTSRIWRSLSPLEASRFLRHARPFWEIHRHRMAPRVGRWLADQLDGGHLRMIAGRVLSATGDPEGVVLELRHRGSTSTEVRRADWVVNCTGPGGVAGLRRAPLLRSLMDAGLLARDEHGLGVRTDDEGRAAAGGRTRPDLFVIGTLRKPSLWESTAVPELREQAATVSRLALASVVRRSR